MPLTAGQWTNAIEQLRSENTFGSITLWHNGNQAANYAALDVRNDATQANVKPLETDLEAAYTRWQTAQTTQTAITTNAQSLRDYAELAQNYHAEIKDLFLAITDADVDSDDTATRFSAIATIIDGTPTAFKNRYNAAFAAESGITTAGLDLAALLLLTAPQKQAYNSFARSFVAHYSMMLLWTM